MKTARRITASLLGLYAGLLGAAHGYFEIRQGSVAPDGLMISAIGPPCQPELATHACFPAMTVIPNFLITGILAVLVGLAAATWAAGFVERKRGSLILMLLAVAMLLVGGGFVALFVGLIASFSAIGLAEKPFAATGTKPTPFTVTQIPRGKKDTALAQLPANARRVLANLWPWPLVAYFAWVFPVQWLLSRFFSEFLASAVLILFFCFDLGLPLLSAVTARLHDRAKASA